VIAMMGHGWRRLLPHPYSQFVFLGREKQAIKDN